MKKYLVTKDIYHKGKLIKKDSVVFSETGHKYFVPYERDEFSNEKEPPVQAIKTPENVEYSKEGWVINPKDKLKSKETNKETAPSKPAAATAKKATAPAASATATAEKTSASTIANSDDESDNNDNEI